jgi:hypothetical protein
VKNHKLEGGVLVDEDKKKVVWRNTEQMRTSSGVMGNWGSNCAGPEPTSNRKGGYHGHGTRGCWEATIVPCAFQKVKSFRGSNNKTKNKKSTEISKTAMLQL